MIIWFITTIESSIFDFNKDKTQATYSYQKANVVHNHYPCQSNGKKWTTVINKFFPLSENFIIIVFIDDNYASDQEAQTHMFIIGTSIGTILKVADPIIVVMDDKFVSDQYAKIVVCII